MNSSQFSIKNILQDAMIRIPFFIAMEPTQTLAMQYNQEIVKHIEQQSIKGILSTHIKLHYQSQTIKPIKILVIVFQNVQFAKMFYHQFSNNENHEANQTHSTDYMNRFVNSIVQVQHQNAIQTSKLPVKVHVPMYYCQDITNLQGILYQMGKVAVQFPDCVHLRGIIRDVAQLVVVEGIRAEEQLKKKIIDEPILQFLDHNILSSENIFYRWRVYSYLQGDGDTNFRTQPFQIVAESAEWYPPHQAFTEKYRNRILNFQERQYFTKLLYSLTLKKSDIEEGMAFCLTNITSFIDISCIISAVMVDLCSKTTTQSLLPLTYLISDILFNSPWTGYRDVFIVLIPLLLKKCINANKLEIDKIANLLQIWQKKYLFEEQYFKGLFYILKPQQIILATKVKESIVNDLAEKDNIQIQLMCYRYGLPLSSDMQENRHNLSVLLSANTKQTEYTSIPQINILYDGDQLTQKDLQKIRMKNCRVICCSGATVKSLFQKNQGSLSIDKE